MAIATDGDAKRRQAVTALGNKEKGKVPAVELSAKLDLFDTYGGKLQLTVDFDLRHVITRLRARVVFTDRGMTLSPKGVPFDSHKVKVSDQSDRSIISCVRTCGSKQKKTFDKIPITSPSSIFPPPSPAITGAV